MPSCRGTLGTYVFSLITLDYIIHVKQNYLLEVSCSANFATLADGYVDTGVHNNGGRGEIASVNRRLSDFVLARFFSGSYQRTRKGY